ncbi:MAG: AAA-like domain-containing protein [Oscillospiraceae bacterium]|nr:AAA-like domain-containing protein [Oscillospiraceae bacterium]
MKEFNTTGVCIPSKHYMVDITERIGEIRKMVDAGKYFAINRARQYGKTTTLNLLRRALQKDYQVVSLDFQGLGNASFRTEEDFCRGFVNLILTRATYGTVQLPETVLTQMNSFVEAGSGSNKLENLMKMIRLWCKKADKPVVLLIDEVDSATNNQVFLDFLAQLREGYINRDTEDAPAFQSVILAGVTDVRHLRSKIRPDEQHKVNSPWNIAAEFDIDMSLSETGIRGMLEEYEGDHHTGMDTAMMAKLLRDYTEGYPFLVSRLCQLMDTKVSRLFESLAQVWTRRGMDEAVKMILSEDNTLFQSLMGKLINYPELKEAFRSILMEGERVSYNPDREDIAQMLMYGFIRVEQNMVKIANRIFETRLYNYFLSEEEFRSNAFNREAQLAGNQFVRGGKLDMRLIMERFIVAYTQICGPLTDRFKEKDGRELFLLYLKPIINGTGNYYIEAQTRDQTRTDVIVDYLGRQYIIELKIWRGERYNAEGERQICEYLDYWNLNAGYMLSFNFNQNKEPGVRRVPIGEKILFEGML